MTSVLESTYVKPTRPYSQNELNDKRTKLFEKKNLINVFAKHERCGHFYRVKNNGKKHTSILENNDPGNCSVCWKISKTPDYLYDNAKELVYLYEERFRDEPSKIDYDMVDIETCYYTWIYEHI